MASLHWLPVKSRIEFKILLLAYKALNGQSPSYLKELIVPYYPTRPLRSQTYLFGLLVVPRVTSVPAVVILLLWSCLKPTGASITIISHISITTTTTSAFTVSVNDYYSL